jgi:hypothetical protein
VRDEIVAKLRAALTAGVASEERVVYVMRSVRKLLEIDGAQQKYPALNFYCNWVLHDKLDRGFARDVISLFDDIHGSRFTNSGLAGDQRWQELHQLTDGESLRAQLGANLVLNDLPNAIALDQSNWRMFLSHYASAVHNTPVLADRPSKFIQRVTLYKEAAERRFIDTPAEMRLIRESFKLTWIYTTLAGDKELAMSVEFPEEWSNPELLWRPEIARSEAHADRNREMGVQSAGRAPSESGIGSGPTIAFRSCYVENNK